MLENSDKLSLNKLIFNLNALVDLGEVATTTKDYADSIKSSLYLVMGTLSVSRGVIFQFNQHKYELNSITSKGIKDVTDLKLKLKKEEVSVLVYTNKAIKRSNAMGFMEKLFTREKTRLDKIMASILVPLVVKGDLVGMIALGKKFSGEEYLKTDYDILEVMAHHIAVVLHNHNLLIKLAAKVDENKKLYEGQRLIYYDTIQAFATAIDAKDAYTQGHSVRVSKYCAAIAKEMGLKKKEIEGLRIAGYLHDIGKITVEKNIINKPGKLTKEELFEINQHPIVSYEILSKIRFPWKDISNNVLHHHEMMDGTGYPDKLQGKAIPSGAKILALADAFDAMTSDRPYRKKLTLEKSLIEIKRTLGKQFDPKIVKYFFKAIKKDINQKKKFAIINELEPISRMQNIMKHLEMRA